MKTMKAMCLENLLTLATIEWCAQGGDLEF